MTTRKKGGNNGDDFRSCSICGEQIKNKNYERHLIRVHKNGPETDSEHDKRSSGNRSSRRKNLKTEKREKLEAEIRFRNDMMAFSALGAIIAIIMIGYFLYTHPVSMPDIDIGGGGDEETGRVEGLKTMVADGTDEVHINISEVKDGKAHYYYYDTNGSRVRYFVVMTPDGEIRSAFDACEKCFDQKKGFRQKDDHMICNSCNQKFETEKIYEETQVCSPVPLNNTVSGLYTSISSMDLQDGVQYFP